jgi:two-component system C4-dicarboxylate transport sensor histidine kinase DctB
MVVGDEDGDVGGGLRHRSAAWDIMPEVEDPRTAADARLDPDLVETGRLLALGRLTPGALHELANPLLALGGTLELLLADAGAGARTHERLQLVKDTADEIARLVRLLQGLSRERLAPAAPLDLRAFVAESVELVRRLAAIRDARVETVLAEAGSVVARPVELRQVVVTLVHNALQHPPANGLVRVELARRGGAATLALPSGGGVALGAEPTRAIVAHLGGELAEEPGGAVRLTLPVAG